MHSHIDIAADTIIVGIVVGVQGTRVFFCAQSIAAKQLHLLCASAHDVHTDAASVFACSHRTIIVNLCLTTNSLEYCQPVSVVVIIMLTHIVVGTEIVVIRVIQLVQRTTER